MGAHCHVGITTGRVFCGIVGSDFRAFVTHESKHFIFFYIGKTAICLYKAG